MTLQAGQHINIVLDQEVGDDPRDMRASVILLQRGAMLLHKWKNIGPYDFVTVSDACKCAVHNHKSCSATGWDATPHHDTTSAEWTSLNAHN